MFNTFLTNILNSYLGEVVEDLDIDNLGIGALNGDILLIDLKLRPDALVRVCYRNNPVSPGVSGAAHRGEVRQHREAEPEDTMDEPEQQPGGGDRAGHLPGGRATQPQALQQGEGREYGHDAEAEVPSESRRHISYEESGHFSELQGGEAEAGVVGDDGGHLHEQHPAADPPGARQVRGQHHHPRNHHLRRPLPSGGHNPYIYCRL